MVNVVVFKGDTMVVDDDKLAADDDKIDAEAGDTTDGEADWIVVVTLRRL